MTVVEHLHGISINWQSKLHASIPYFTSLVYSNTHPYIIHIYTNIHLYSNQTWWKPRFKFNTSLFISEIHLQSIVQPGCQPHFVPRLCWMAPLRCKTWKNPQESETLVLAVGFNGDSLGIFLGTGTAVFERHHETPISKYNQIYPGLPAFLFARRLMVFSWPRLKTVLFWPGSLAGVRPVKVLVQPKA